MSVWPITFDDVLAARERLQRYLPPTPLRHYAELDAAVGHGIRVLVKHENHQPGNAFKVRNALSMMLRLDPDQKRRGVVGATRGNHGLGMAWAGDRLGVPVTLCVPHGNNPEKNQAMRGLGAEVIEHGRDYDESLQLAKQLVAERGLCLVHSTNDRDVLAGAATLTLELVEQAAAQAEDLAAMVVAIGGGSQAVGALTVLRERHPDVAVYGVQASAAPAIHDSWHAGEPLTRDSADTFADGLATRSTYELTFPPLRAGLAGFTAVSEAEIAEALRVYLRTTHNLVEGAAAAALAGVYRLAPEMAGKTVAIILSGSNIDAATLRAVINREI